MADELISVIVPVYNTEKYLEKMIECLLNQTYKNLQIIFVDDGSKDGSANIIKKYMGDERIEYYYKENGGVSSARNFGLTKIKGKKLFMFDSDDIFEETLIEDAYIYSKSNNVESVIYGYANLKNGVVSEIHKFSLSGNYYKEDIVKKVIPSFVGNSIEDLHTYVSGKTTKLRANKEHTALWRTMFDSSIIEVNTLRFDTNLTIGEDTKFTIQYLLCTNSIGILDKTLYYLNIRDNSANVSNEKDCCLMLKNKIKMIEARNDLNKFANDKGIDLFKYYQGTYLLSCVQIFIKYAVSNVGFRRSRKDCISYVKCSEIQESIKNYKIKYIRIKNIPFIMLKLKMYSLLLFAFKIMPKKVLNKFVNM